MPPDDILSLIEDELDQEMSGSSDSAHSEADGFRVPSDQKELARIDPMRVTHEELAALKKNKEIGLFGVSQSSFPPDIEKESSANERPGIERRRFERVDASEADFSVKFQSQLKFAQLYVQDLSRGGMFIKSSKQIPLGESLVINFSVPNLEAEGGREDFTLKAKVVRSLPSGMGLSFEDMDPWVAQRIEQLVIKIREDGRRNSPGAQPTRALGSKRIERKHTIPRGVRVSIVVAALVALAAVGIVKTREPEPDKKAAIPQAESPVDRSTSARRNAVRAKPTKKLSLKKAGIKLNLKGLNKEEASKQ